VGHVFVFSLTAALNPTLLAATTLMLVLPSPRGLLLGYLCGAMLTSVTIGCVLVLTVGASTSGTSTAKHTLNPIWDIVLGTLVLTFTFLAGTGRGRWQAEKTAQRREKKAAKKAGKKPPKWQQALTGGTPRTTFLIGCVLTLPGASYLAALDGIAKQDFSWPLVVVTVIAVNIVMLVLLEVPLIGYTISPDKTAATIERAKTVLQDHGGRVLLVLLTVAGVALVLRGALELLT
jgi:Sap, sulfolipid-1-addressing protein